MAEMNPERLLPHYTRLTAPFNVTGQPALSVPCGLSPADLPIGLQTAARAHHETVVLRIGKALEKTGLWEPGRAVGLKIVHYLAGG